MTRLDHTNPAGWAKPVRRPSRLLCVLAVLLLATCPYLLTGVAR